MKYVLNLREYEGTQDFYVCYEGSFYKAEQLMQTKLFIFYKLKFYFWTFTTVMLIEEHLI